MKRVWTMVMAGAGALLCVGALAQVVGSDFEMRPVFPGDNAWNADVSHEAVDPNSAAFIARIGAGKPLHPDFGKGINGIPFQFVNAKTPRVPVTFEYADESDKGPYPIPDAPLIEGGPGAKDGDRHILMIDTDALGALRVVAGGEGAGRLARGEWRDLGFEGECVAAGGVDVGGCGGVADFSRPGAV